MQDAPVESDDRREEVLAVRLEDGQEYREDFEVSASTGLRWTWKNVSTTNAEIPRQVLEEESRDRDWAAISWNKDDVDGHKRVYILSPRSNQSMPDMVKLEFEEHTIEMSSTSAGTTRHNATATGPPLS